MSRLVTLTGVGGSGKTRLALEVASAVETELRDGAVLVELAPLADPTVVPQAITHALGLGDLTGRSPEEALIGALQETEILLVLDNCEHLVARCAALVETLLKASPAVKVLATSREALDVVGEVVFGVPPLSLPPVASVETVDDLARFESTQLFCERAANARAGNLIDDGDASAVADICHRLDGLPLAIELAAARMRSMSAHDILRRLDDQFALLTRLPRRVASRHHALRSTIDWSYDLLSTPERTLFARVAIFAGGWLLDDALAVCAGEPLTADDIIELSTALVERSLVVAEPALAGESRFRLLETLRAYAWERLVASGELEQLRRRHFQHFLAMAESYSEARLAGGSDAGLPALAAHRDNFRAALSSGIGPHPGAVLRLAAALEDLWRMVSAAEGWEWLQRALAAAPPDSFHRRRALLSAGMLAAYIPAYAEGAGLLRDVASDARRSGDRSAEAWADLWLGRIAFFSGDAGVAEERLREAVSLHEQLGNTVGLVRARSLLGLLQALLLRRGEEAERHLHAAGALAREVGDSFGEGYAEMMLGLCAAERDDIDGAASHSRVALGVSALGPLLGIPLQVIAHVVRESDPALAMRLLGAAALHLERTGTVAPPFLVQRSEATRSRAEELLGSAAAAQSWADGRRTTLAEAITLSAIDVHRRPERSGALTSRELQVAALVAQGRTNREVAETLHMSLRTAESHVDHILTKTGLRNRTELAAWSRANLAEIRQ